MQCFGGMLNMFFHSACKAIIISSNSVTMRGWFSASITAAISRTRFGCHICAMMPISLRIYSGPQIRLCTFYGHWLTLKCALHYIAPSSSSNCMFKQISSHELPRIHRLNCNWSVRMDRSFSCVCCLRCSCSA